MCQVRALPEQPTAVRRTRLRPEQLVDWVPSACAAVAEQLRHHDIAPVGFPFARWRTMSDGVIEAEAGFPVSAPIPANTPIEQSVLPGGPVVAVWHTAPDEKLDLTYQAIEHWLEADDAIASGDSWEIYHDLPVCDHVGNRIEVIQPITFAPA
ncbi:GyrI-like domain-containing protein [Kribbella sp. NBC_00709]|uniref:GyrI-like domain-containing protein n=1 Tax=Kribbella sp. NBC_00709 TaxID=2975972 RepID=UPI002E2C621D|nr:GyrI-like domain-containing protein [Kribbella sp. NBC_00709]